jgi:ribosomal protein S18 acetylase RimI-like enzyme
VTIREATEADLPDLRVLVDAYHDEFWTRPFQPPALPDEWFREGRLLVAELDGHLAGIAKGLVRRGRARVSLVFVRAEFRRQGAGKALLRELMSFFREQGVDHVTLGVDLSNADALAVWRRLGFTEFRRELITELGALEQRLAEPTGAASFGSVHVQTDDQGAVERAVTRFVPRLFRSRATVVAPPTAGWIGVYDELADREPKQLRRLAAELSHVTGTIVFSIGVEEGQVVRYAAFDRGQIVDEYLSVPEFYGPLPPGDVVALRANRTVLARLTGADPSRVRLVAATASSPAELPPAREHVLQLGDLLGISGTELGFDEARELPGGTTVEHP